jgi:hypothetical protein
VDSVAPFPYKLILDAYKGYHQVQMIEHEEDKTTFYMEISIFCYSKIPFGLKNAGVTYQRMIEKSFKHQIGRNLEVCVNYLVIKSRNETDMLADI